MCLCYCFCSVVFVLLFLFCCFCLCALCVFLFCVFLCFLSRSFVVLFFVFCCVLIVFVYYCFCLLLLFVCYCSLLFVFCFCVELYVKRSGSPTLRRRSVPAPGLRACRNRLRWAPCGLPEGVPPQRCGGSQELKSSGVGYPLPEAGGQVGAVPVAVSWGWHPRAPRSGQHVLFGLGGHCCPYAAGSAH